MTGEVTSTTSGAFFPPFLLSRPVRNRNFSLGKRHNKRNEFLFWILESRTAQSVAIHTNTASARDEQKQELSAVGVIFICIRSCKSLSGQRFSPTTLRCPSARPPPPPRVDEGGWLVASASH